MTPTEYRTALATLGLTQKAAGEWLGVSEKTAKRYATTGPSGPAARAIECRLEAKKKEGWVCYPPLSVLETGRPVTL